MGEGPQSCTDKVSFFEIKVAIPFLLLAGSGICLFRDLWTRDGLVC